MKKLIFILTLAISSSAFAGLKNIPEKSFTQQAIVQAIHNHYDSLTTNEQWGVGMGCALGRLENHLKNAKSIRINEETGLILAEVDYTPHIIKGPTRYSMYINFAPGTQEISKITVIATSKSGLKSSCSTRDGLLKVLNDLSDL